MPYIKDYLREDLRDGISAPSDPGQLNFVLTNTCLEYVHNAGECYETYNSIVGALECCKQEFYRRMISPYEDNKKITNGDVFA